MIAIRRNRDKSQLISTRTDGHTSKRADRHTSTRTDGHTSNDAPNAVSSKDFIFKSALISVQKKKKRKKELKK